MASGHRGKGLGAALTTRAIALATDLGVRQLVLLTLTAEKYFPRFGFSRIARDEVPASIKESGEFRDACPASAVVMIRLP